MDINYIGGLAEQLVAQEYMAYLNPHKPQALYYWHREQRTSNAEVDFIFTRDSQIFPVEVKSGVKGGMKSIHVFLESHPHSTYGPKISQNVYSQSGRLINVPLYGLEAWLQS